MSPKKRDELYEYAFVLKQHDGESARWQKFNPAELESALNDDYSFDVGDVIIYPSKILTVKSKKELVEV